MKTIDDLNRMIKSCNKCSLGKKGKQVCGEGPIGGVLLLGEAPGLDEENKGIPFIGRSGQLLRQMIREHFKINDKDIRITNTVHCRPESKTGANRTPTQTEINTCNFWLQNEINIVQPKLIITVGRIPLIGLFGKIKRITDYRQKVLIYNGFRVIATYHPAAILRNPTYKSLMIEDLDFARRVLLSV